MLNSQKDFEVNVWARTLGLGPTLFKDLPRGARFVFRMEDAQNPTAIYVKAANSYRSETSNRHFRTGARTACFPLDKQEQPTQR